jgi:DNA-binding transcriptional ArsR family regulator
MHSLPRADCTLPGQHRNEHHHTRRLRAVHRTDIYNHMVARHPLSDAEIDRVFHALADATRRDIVARVLAGEQASISALAARYEMSFAAVQKHVAVLEGAGLVTKQAQGRERIVRGNPERIARARELLARLEELWKARFSQLDSLFSDTRSQE